MVFDLEFLIIAISKYNTSNCKGINYLDRIFCKKQLRNVILSKAKDLKAISKCGFNKGVSK